MESNYVKIFGGNPMVSKQLVEELHNAGIEAIVKDEAESARLAGFASSMLNAVEVFVHKDEKEKALKIVNEMNFKS